MEKKQNISNSINTFPTFIKGLLVCFTLSLILIFLLSLFLSVTNISSDIIFPAIIFISSLSILISSFFTTKSINKSGLINGALLGFSYMLLIYIISSIMNNSFTINFSTLLMIIFGILGGIVGGIIGVNIKK